VIDLHAHVLPGIDDGPETTEEAVKLLQQVKAQGVSTLVVTPHFLPGVYEPSRQAILDGISQLQPLVPDIRLLPGAEIYLDSTTIALVAAEKVFTLGGRGSHVLVELPMAQLPLYTRRALSQLQETGLTPVLAHPERNPVLMSQRREIEALRASGVLFQVDAGSIAGDNGPQVQRSCRYLCEQELIDIVATDCHSLRRRPPKLQEALAEARRWGWDLTPLVLHNPAVILGEAQTLVKSQRVRKPSLLEKVTGRAR
jgi:protein-tyrosine phosphatase